MGSTEKVMTGLEMTPEDTGAGRFGQGAILNMVTARAHQRTPDQPCADCLDHSLGAGRRKPAVPRRGEFWLVALILAATMLGTTLPTPLYVIYQAQWHFSAAIVTVTFAVYAAGVLAALLLAGRSSDQAGRRPVLAVALGASALSTVVFIVAPGVGALLAARILSGLSAGLMTGTATAALTELVPAPAGRRASLVATAANMGGLGLGPLIAGLFSQYAPHPTTLVFEVYLAVLAAAGLCLLFIPETVSPRQRPAVRLTGLGIPERSRGEFIAAAVAAFAAFSLLGLFAALAPTFLGNVLHEDNHAVQGAVVFLLFAAGTAIQLLLSRFPSRRIMVAGLGLLLPALAPPGRRGQIVSTYFVACYGGLIVPVVGVGIASGFIGDFPAVLALSVLLAALCLVALACVGRTHAPDGTMVSR